MEISTLIGLIGLVIAIIGLLITLIEKWDVIAPRVQIAYQTTLAKFTISNLNLSRRYFLGAGAIVVLGAMTYSLKFFDISIFRKNNRWQRFSVESNFIVNSKNGVIHLKGVCDDHLPIAATVVTNHIATHLHSYKRQQITKSVVDNLPDELSEELLIEAIKESPTSTHLYKYLIKQWGRKKEYSKIHEFLSVNIKFLKSKLASIKTDKARRKYNKAIGVLSSRQIRAEYLASISKF